MISELFTTYIYLCMYVYYYKFEKTHLQIFGQRSFSPHHAVQIAYAMVV
jgi:hypothetical protein